MVASWAYQRNDSRRSKLLAVGAIRRFWNVAKLVAQSWVSKLTRRHVAVFPAFAIGFTIIFAEQPELRPRSIGESLIFSDKSILQPDQHNLFTDFASLFAHVTELQSDISELLAKLVIFAIVAFLQSDQPQVPSSESRLFGFILTDEPLLADVAILQPDITGLLANKSKLLSIESQLFGTLASVLIDYAKLQSIEPELHADDTAVLSVEPKLFDTALFAKLAVILSQLYQIQPIESELQPNVAFSLSLASIHTAKSTELLLSD